MLVLEVSDETIRDMFSCSEAEFLMKIKLRQAGFDTNKHITVHENFETHSTIYRQKK